MPRETLRLLPRTVIPSAAEGSPLQAGKRWVFDDEKREVLSLPPKTPVVISGVQERFLDFARNDDTEKALSSEPLKLKKPAPHGAGFLVTYLFDIIHPTDAIFQVDENILHLAVVFEHDLVRFTTDAGLLVAAKRCACR